MERLNKFINLYLLRKWIQGIKYYFCNLSLPWGGIPLNENLMGGINTIHLMN